MDKWSKNSVHYLLLILLVFLVEFLKLGSFPMRHWDESMFAVNTYEMMQNGNYFSLFYDGVPDLYNTKPPLTNWLQLLSARLFGFTEFAIRLPSALAILGTVLVLFNVLKRKFSTVWAWGAALVLLTSQGFIGYHTGRTGDSDALLTFFVLLTNIAFLAFLIQSVPS